MPVCTFVDDKLRPIRVIFAKNDVERDQRPWSIDDVCVSICEARGLDWEICSRLIVSWMMKSEAVRCRAWIAERGWLAEWQSRKGKQSVCSEEMAGHEKDGT